MTVIDTDMFNDSEKVAYLRWSFGIQDNGRVYVTNLTKDFKITEDNIGIYDTENSVYVVSLEVKIVQL